MVITRRSWKPFVRKDTWVRIPLSPPRRSKVRFAPTYFYACGIKISHPPASLLLLFRKRSRSRRLFACKRAHKRLWLTTNLLRGGSAATNFLRGCSLVNALATLRLATNLLRLITVSHPPASLLLLFRKRSRASEQVTLVPIFYFIKNQSPAPLFLLSPQSRKDFAGTPNLPAAATNLLRGG